MYKLAAEMYLQYINMKIETGGMKNNPATK